MSSELEQAVATAEAEYLAARTAAVAAAEKLARLEADAGASAAARRRAATAADRAVEHFKARQQVLRRLQRLVRQAQGRGAA